MAKNPVVRGKEEPEKPFVCGIYQGNATADPSLGVFHEVFQQVDLGFSPSFVAVWNRFGQQFTLGNGVPAYVGGAAVRGYPCILPGGAKVLEIAADGFRAYSSWEYNGASRAEANREGVTYYYIAFR